MNSAPESHYVHGTSPEEQDRLALLSPLLDAPCLAQLGDLSGLRVLDLGTGTGLFARGMARTGAAVVAVERSGAQLETARRLAREADEEGLVDWRPGAVPDLPLSAEEEGSFDVVHARFLLEHLTQPRRAVEAMVAAARPGGRIVLLDDDHTLMRLDPDPGGMRRLWDLYGEVYRRLGNDPEVGRHLVEHLAASGARPARSTWIHFGGCAGDANFTLLADNLAGVVSGARSAILETGGVEKSEFDRALARFHAWSRRPDATIGYAVPWAEGVVPR